MPVSLDWKRIALFLGLAFGLAWLTALVLALNGQLADSPVLVPGTTMTLALVLLAGPYMWAPTLAHLLTRLITREGWREVGLRPLTRGWPYWLAAWVLPAVLTILGLVVYFLVAPGRYDPELGVLRDLLAKAGQPGVNPWFVAAVQTLQGVLIAPLINGLFTFGEEFGWRAYLQPKLLALGPRRAMLVMGVIWGVWHWPVIAMGHNYGLSYAGYPWLGMLAMVWFTLVTGVFLGWVTVRSGSVWAAVIGHAALNGIAGLGALFVRGELEPLLGPLPTGLIGSAGWAVLALALLVWPGAWRPAGAAAPSLVPTPPAPAPVTGRAPQPAPAERLERLDDSRYTE
ncbi:MAG: CPBP family intramembrane metalloprotease [Anaerolineales bacterium]|nr:CPBP family intramembrane metalloprotease [Anaerolineales bacterium]